MGPPWSGQGTVPHTTVSDLLSTDVLVSPPGAPVGAGEDTCSSCAELRYHWCVVPADVVLAEEVTVLLLLQPNTAVTLTVQLLPALSWEMMWVVAPPSTVAVPDVCCEPHKS